MDLFPKANPPKKRKFSLNPEQTDYYEVLNIAKNSTKSQIREAYIRLKNAFSSQSQALYSLISDDESELMLNSIEEAFRVLNDDFSKREYDIKIGLCISEASRIEEKNQFSSATNYETTANNAFKGNVGHGLHTFSGTYESAPDLTDPMKFSSSLASKNICADTVDLEATKSKMQEAIEIFEIHDGELYKKLREIAGVSEEEIQERTKVSLQYIRAIEQNAFEKLPALVFVKGFLRSYLKYLKVQQAEDMVKAFANRFENWQHDTPTKSS